MPVGKYKIGLIAQERKPHLTNAVVGDPRVSDQDWAQREGMVAFAGYPLVVEDRLVGVMAMFARHALSEATLGAMASVADEIAVGIERKPAEERLQRAAGVAAGDARQHRRRGHRHRRRGAGHVPQRRGRGADRLDAGRRAGASRSDDVFPHPQRADPAAGREPGREGAAGGVDRRPGATTPS